MDRLNYSATLIRLFVLCVVISSVAGIGRAEPASSSLLIRNVRVFDGEKTIAHADVAVTGGKIVAVGPHLNATAGAEVIDGSGKTVLPGLIDAHVHNRGLRSLRSDEVYGVTTVLDMGTANPQGVLRIKAAESAGRYLDAADIRSAGIYITAPGGHGTHGRPVPTINEPGEAKAFVDARIAEGSDYIKVIYEDGHEYGRSIPNISKATMVAAIAAAHKRRKMAVVHIGSYQGAQDAIEAGADGLAHLFVDRAPDADFGRFIASHHAFVITTMAVIESSCGIRGGEALARDPELSPYLLPDQVTNLKLPFKHGGNIDYTNAEKTLRMLRDAGVPILAGTDAPNPGTTFGASLHRELELIVKAGITPVEALAAATSVPARIFGLHDRGRIAPGLRADLVLVNADPTTDITATRNIVAVWKAGVRCDRASFRTIATDERAVWDRLGPGWFAWTDEIFGGDSEAKIRLGADSAMVVSGEVKPGAPRAFAGVMLGSATSAFQPVDLARAGKISFEAKGDARTYSLLVFTRANGMNAAFQTFSAGPDWKRFEFPFSDFETDGHDVTAIEFLAANNPGKFQLELRDVNVARAVNPPTGGKRKWLGLELGAVAKQGAVVESVDPASPAERAGLAKGDVVTDFDGSPIHDAHDLANQVQQEPSGKRVHIIVLRNGRRLNREIEIGERE